MNKIEEILNHGLPFLTEDQSTILDECIIKRVFGLALFMGYGKTLLSLVIGLKKKIMQNNFEPILIIASKSLISTWTVEITKFFGTKINYQIMNVDSANFVLNPNTLLVISTPETAAKFYKENMLSEKFITHVKYNDGGPFPRIKNVYGSPQQPYLRSAIGGSILYQKKWASLVIDEGHKYTNIVSGRCQALGALCSSNRWILSGTMFNEPQVERILGYYVMLHWPNFPKDLPEATIYLKSKEFKGTQETLITRKATELAGVKVNKIIVEHNLDPDEAQIYISMKQTLKILKDHLNKIKYHNKLEKKKFSAYVMSMITYLRQSIVVPILPIANIALEMSEMKSIRSELSLILTKQFNTLNLHDFLNKEESVKSSRIKKVLETISKHNLPTDKIVVFSCFRTSLDILTYFVNEEIPIDIYTLESTMTVIQRGKLIKEFQETKANSILFLTYEMGSEGLNLQAANTVIILDFWWNVSSVKQAVSRVVRNGQKSAEVNVYFYTSNTGIEKALFEKQLDKTIVLQELQTGPMVSEVKMMKMDMILQLIDRHENVKFLTDMY